MFEYLKKEKTNTYDNGKFMFSIKDMSKFE